MSKIAKCLRPQLPVLGGVSELRWEGNTSQFVTHIVLCQDLKKNERSRRSWARVRLRGNNGKSEVGERKKSLSIGACDGGGEKERVASLPPWGQKAVSSKCCDYKSHL